MVAVIQGIHQYLSSVTAGTTIPVYSRYLVFSSTELFFRSQSTSKIDYVGPATVGFPQLPWGWKCHTSTCLGGWTDTLKRKWSSDPSLSQFGTIKGQGRTSFRPPVSTGPYTLSWDRFRTKGNWALPKSARPQTLEPLARDAMAKHMADQSQTSDRYYHYKLALPMSRLIKHTMT